MVLRAITVRGVKCFRNEVTVGPFGDGLNMIFSPNETGKSTLIEATARALFDGYTVTGEAIDGLRPWETTLAPEITLEFEAGGEQWRLQKRLLSGPECTLSRMESGGWSLVHERDAADDFVRDLLHGTAPGRGPSDLRHWGLARTLWCLRDPCVLGRADAACVVPSAVAGQLQAVLGEGTVATALDAVTDRLGHHYDEYFTPKTAKPRAGSPLDTMQREIEQLEQQRAEAEQDLRQVEDAAERLQAIGEELEGLQDERERLQEQIAEYREAAEEIAALQQEIKGIESELERARSERDDVAEDLERFVRARQSAEDAERQLTESAGTLEALDANLAAAQQLLEEAEEERREAQTERKRAARELERGRNTEQALSLLEERQSLTELLAEIEELANQREALERRLQEMPCPDDGEVERADSLERRIERLQTQLEGAGLTARVEALAEQEVALSGGDAELREIVGEGQEIAYTAGSSMMIDLPEVARISVRSGASEPAELQEQLADAREQLRDLLAPFGAADSAALRDLQHDYERITEDLNRHEERMQQAVAPFEAPEQARDRQGDVRVELTKRLNELELTEDELQELESPDLDALEDQLRAAQAREDSLQDRVGERRERAEELAQQREQMREERHELEASLRENQAAMAGLLERHDCDDEDAIEAVLEDANREVDLLEETLAAKRQNLPSEESDPRQLLETAEHALGDINNREIELAGQRGDSQGIIERAQTEGRYEQLSRIEEQLAARRRELREKWSEAQAIKLLQQLIDGRRSESMSGALPGLEEKVARMLRHITGRDRPLRMNEEMKVTGIFDGETAHDPAHLSSGAREQLDLVTRIALGETYAEHYDRAMMVLDDPLLYTDPRRHGRIKQILQRAADLLQVFILTSHPDRYRGIIPTDCQFDLEAIGSTAS